ncbi:MAG TPA: translocation/assembly module TamB domain-containing protein [Acidobacteriota bacterium]|nr:translocation/assembly module TamB domain-containing protein [Acidobacteriota bacterium]
MSPRLKKILAIPAILLVLAVVFFFVYLNSGSFARRAQAWLVDWMEARYQVEVELDGLDLDIFRLRARLTGLRIFQRPRQYPEPALQFESVLVDAHLSVLFSDEIRLQRVDLNGPVLRLRSPQDGPFNLRAMFAGKTAGAAGGGSGFDLGSLTIEELNIDRGRLIYNDRVLPITTTRFGFRGAVEAGITKGSYQGRLALSGLDLETEKVLIPSANVAVNLSGNMEGISDLRIDLDSAPLKAALQGQIADFSSFAYQFQAEIESRVEDLKRPGFLDSLQSAPLRSRGTLTGQGKSFLYQGRVTSALVTAYDLDFQEISAQITVDAEKADFSDLGGIFRGGRISGSGRLAISEDLQTEIKAQVEGTRLDGFHRLLSGRADASIDLSYPGRQWEKIRGRGRGRYQAELKLDLLDPRLPALSLAGSTPIRIAESTVYLQGGEASGEGLALKYSFQIDGDQNYRGQASLQAEWADRLLQAVLIEYAQQLPPQLQDRLALRGALRLEAQLKGRGDAFNLRSQLEPTQVLWQGEPMGRLSAQALWTPEALHLEEIHLQEGPVDGQGLLLLPLPHPADFTLRMQARAANLPVELFESFLPPELEAGGRVSGDLRLSRAPAQPWTLQSDFSLTQPRLLGRRLDSLSGRLSLAEQRLLLENLQGSLEEGSLRGSLTALLDEESFQELRLQARNLPLEPLAGPDLPLAGRADLTLDAQGPWTSPDFDLRIEAPALSLADYKLEDAKLSAQGRQGRVEFQFEHRMYGSDVLHSQGTVSLQPPYQADARLSFADLALGPFIQEAAEVELGDAFAAQVTGSVTFKGDLAQLARADIGIDLDTLHLTSTGYELSNPAPLKASLRQGMIRIEPFTVQGPQTALTLSGNISVQPPRELQLRLEGNTNLRLFNDFLPSGVMSGEVQLNTVISGSLADPRIVGSGSLSKGIFYSPDLFTSLYNVRGEFKFNPSQVSIDSLRAGTSMGQIQAQGGIFLNGFLPESWQINLYGTGLQPSFPENVLSVVDANLDYLKSEAGQLITGSVVVRSAEYTRNISLTELITGYLTGTDLDLYEQTGSDIDLDVSVEGYRALRVDNNLADLNASADLRVRGTVASPVLLGNINIDRGELTLEGNDYSINRGVINFNDPRRTKPNINFEAETNVRDFDVTVQIRGPLDRLNFNFRSDPPLPQPDIFSLLAVGETLEDLGGGGGDSIYRTGSLGVVGAGRVLSRALGESLESRTDKLFGLQRFTVDPFLADEGRDPGARITLGRQISDNVGVTYVTDIGSENSGQIVIVEIQLLEWLTAVATREQDGSLAVDFKLKKRF